MVNLRPYQQEAVNAILNDWKSQNSVLLVQATGTGKTIVFSEIAKKVTEDNGRVLVLAHRDELINQASEKLYSAQGITAGIEKASAHAKDEPVIVGSVQTLKNSQRLKRFSPDFFTHIIIDEAHHATAEQYQKILKYFNTAKVLGVTATPYRGDQEDLSKVFDKVASEYSLIEAIRDEYLSPIKIKQIPLQIDLNSVHQSMGDFKATELDNTLLPYLESIADVMVDECRGRKTVVFLPLIETSKKFTSILIERGINAVEIDGKTQNRKEILNDFENGKIDVLCNSLLLTEGWDCPSVDCIVNLRPTRSRTLYVQIIGRGTRIASEKDDLLILDFLWLSDRFDICKPSLLVAKNKEHEKKINEYLDSGQEINLKEASEEAEHDIVKEREEKLAKELEVARHRKGKLIDPIQYGISIEAEDLIDYIPQFMWERGPMTDKQRACLEKGDINVEDIPNAGYASKLIDRLKTRNKLGLSTPKQIRLLERYGFRNVGLWTKKAASKVIGIIAANNWRVPRRINPKCYKPND